MTLLEPRPIGGSVLTVDAYTWHSRTKGLPVETISWSFTDEEIIAFSGQGRVPVLVDGDKVLTGSWTIANYLENNAEGASLLGGPAGLALTRFIESWTDYVLLSGPVRLILIDVFACLRENVRAYFRSSREQRLGMTLEAACADRDHRVIGFRQSLEPFRTTLKTQPFVGGEAPNYADYLLLGGFMWARSTSPFKLLSNDDPIALWRDGCSPDSRTRGMLQGTTPDCTSSLESSE